MSVRGNRKKYDRFNNADDALTLFNKIIEKYPKPWIMEFTKLLAAVVRMKHYAVVVSMYSQMELLGVFHNVYSSNILINSFCQLNQIDFGFSVLGKMLKLRVEPDALTLSTLIHGFCKQSKILRSAKPVPFCRNKIALPLNQYDGLSFHLTSLK
ncbi:hypothetical protein Gogos_008651 [Gossypium gossypioides]|uniref:Pentacotripeptide-repeat region of PRORP domain-containing protein n=1 Tax=Gossypium gossypioides TaxID=34282 RepID=A0A7J9CCJ9_GOSGO|nr:hypothetical protein [Gossypium gossypioides]